MDDEEFEFCEIEQPARRWHKADLAVLALDLVSGISAAITNTLERAHDVAAMNANWQIRQAEFEEEAVLAIERITTGEDDG